MSPSEMILAGICVFLALAGVICLIASIILIRISRRNPQRSSEAFSVDIAALTGELEKAALHVDKQIAGRLNQLNRLLDETDARITQLRELTADAVGRQIGHGEGMYQKQHNAQNKEVLRLAEQGLDTIEIARRLGLNVGEVELVLNLHNRS